MADDDDKTLKRAQLAGDLVSGAGCFMSPFSAANLTEVLTELLRSDLVVNLRWAEQNHERFPYALFFHRRSRRREMWVLPASLAETRKLQNPEDAAVRFQNAPVPGVESYRVLRKHEADVERLLHEQHPHHSEEAWE